MDKLKKDSYFLVWFIKGKSVYGIQKELGFKEYSYNSIYNRFMAFRKEIAEYCDANNIPSAADYELLGPKAKSDYRDFEARLMNKYSVIKSWNYYLYIREVEFRYHFRHLKPRELVEILTEIHFAKRF